MRYFNYFNNLQYKLFNVVHYSWLCYLQYTCWLTMLHDSFHNLIRWNRSILYRYTYIYIYNLSTNGMNLANFDHFSLSRSLNFNILINESRTVIDIVGQIYVVFPQLIFLSCIWILNENGNNKLEMEMFGIEVTNNRFEYNTRKVKSKKKLRTGNIPLTVFIFVRFLLMKSQDSQSKSNTPCNTNCWPVRLFIITRNSRLSTYNRLFDQCLKWY